MRTFPCAALVGGTIVVACLASSPAALATGGAGGDASGIAGGGRGGAESETVAAAGMAGGGGAGAAPQLPRPEVTCTEYIPEGKTRPEFSDGFPARGVSGHAAWLRVTVNHWTGERVLPGGFQVQLGSAEARQIENSGFLFPDPKGPVKTRIQTREEEGRATTTVDIPFVPLPKTPGRQRLELPSLPIAIARSSGEILTVCTAPHSIEIDPPNANDPGIHPKPNPAPLRQLEEWTLLKNLTYGGILGLLVAGLGYWLFRMWRRRPKTAAPPPPPRPAWEVALEALHDLRHARLIEQQRYADHFDRVSDIVRRYLGDRYGFDGLESTTREIVAQLERTRPRVEMEDEIKTFLRSADLVKFARLTPTEAECHAALERGEQIVRRTTPSLVTHTEPLVSPSATDPEKPPPHHPGGAS